MVLSKTSYKYAWQKQIIVINELTKHINDDAHPPNGKAY